MRECRLSKYGFRLNLKATLKVISWFGLFYYTILCAIGISLLIIPPFLVKYLNSSIIPKLFGIQEFPEPNRNIFQSDHIQIQVQLRDAVSILVETYLYNIMMPVGAVVAVWGITWFGFFFVLRRKVAKEDFVGTRNLLAKSTLVRGGIWNAVNAFIIIGTIVRLSIKVGGAYACMLMLLSIIILIFNSIMFEGVYHRKAKPVEVFIIFSHIIFILWALSLLIGTAVVSVHLEFPWFFFAGFILFLMSLLVYALNISIILCLHSIILSSSTEINGQPIFSRADLQIMHILL